MNRSSTRRTDTARADRSRGRLLPCVLLAVVCAWHALVGCNPVKGSLEERRKFLSQSSSVLLPIVWVPELDHSFVDGALMAIEEMNATGGLLGKHIEGTVVPVAPLPGMHRGEATASRKIAQKLALDPRVFAVIGHPTSDGAIAASTTYNRFRVVFVASGATSEVLTQHQFRFLFRTLSSDYFVGRALADFAVTTSLKQFAVIHSGSAYGIGLTQSFVEGLGSQNREKDIILRHIIRPGEDDFHQLIYHLKALGVDGVLLATDVEQGALFLSQAREMNLTATVFAGDGLYTQDLVERIGSAANGLIIASAATGPNDPQLSGDFAKRYEQRFHRAADGWAVEGYDAVRLLVDAVRRGKAFDPDVVSSMLKFSEGWNGLAGTYRFDRSGDVISRRILLRRVDGLVYQRLPDADQPAPVVKPDPLVELAAADDE